MSLCDKVKQLVKEGWKLIDVREPQEFAVAHIEGATNVRLHDIHTLGEGKYVLYCRSGARSGIAQEELTKVGTPAINAGGINQFIGCLKH